MNYLTLTASEKQKLLAEMQERMDMYASLPKISWICRTDFIKSWIRLSDTSANRITAITVSTTAFRR